MLGEEQLRLAEEFCKDEYIDYMIYKYLSEHEKHDKHKKILEELAKDEYRHYEFWKNIVDRDCSQEISSGYLRRIKLMRKIFGLTFTLKWLERHEEEVVEAYKDYLKYLDGPEKEKLQEIIADEEKHEHELMSNIEETIVKYMSFIVLGLADAIVEITGVHAGFLGVTSYTIMAGIAGLIVGLSAAISMSSAAYIQAKHDPTRNPTTSAIMTGIGYVGAVVLLALPYFATHNMAYAFTASILLGVLLIGIFTFYGSIVFDRNFKREFIESVGLMLGTAFASYVFGEIIGAYFGIRNIFG
ncbi:MAG: VIT1/CCC1 family protein [Desulfurococcales archaeon]|nr:VIT1/CCC1 family protein [Desulfurococcales archaeon]